MNRPILILAIVLAGVSAYLMWMFTRELESKYNAGDAVSIVVARVDLPEGATLRSGVLEERRIPKAFFHPASVESKDRTLMDGRTIANALQPGQPVLWSDIVGGDSDRRSLGDYVSGRERALTIKVDATSAMGGNLRPNDRVDVLVTLVSPQTGEETTKTLLANVMVIATGTQIGSEVDDSTAGRNRSFSTVTLQVLDIQAAQMITFAQSKGRLSLIVRSSKYVEGDESIAPVGWDAIFGAQHVEIQKRHNARQVQRETEKKTSIEIIGRNK